ncbi:hypothetical protein BC937DRAFT_94122 [Endogone sp. FLAS-F59071]|nr:hypothetical protein BC937DRAFT_94122 [Endogone sp. FLAS-F59071]|eukprot:RUS23002.1 hypothetical protein BC937DRAFT_94122 [Endogone sp. FLAS-F59071]
MPTIRVQLVPFKWGYCVSRNSVHTTSKSRSSITTLAGIDILLKHNHPRAGVHIDRADFERIYVVKFHILANTEVEEGDEIKGEVAQQIQSSFTACIMEF